jgi:hypothetical protein
MPPARKDAEQRDDEDDPSAQSAGKEKAIPTTSSAPKDKPRNPRGGFHRKPGRRVMKEYPLTQGELWGLGGVSLAATIFLSFASFCLSNAFELYKELSFDATITPALSGYWHAMMCAFIWGGILWGVLGLIFIVINGLSLRRIINETVHD